MMSKKMLISRAQELRVALVNGQELYYLDLESPGKEQKRANIYSAVVIRDEPSLEAVFVKYQKIEDSKLGFLPYREIAPEYFQTKDRNNKPRIKENTEMIVQVEKEERGNKGAALTTYVSLAGSYLVLMPNNPRGGGISRRIEGEERQELKDALAELDVPKGMSIIIRTAGVGKNSEELQWDLNNLIKQWSAIQEATATQPAPFLIYQESNIVLRSLRDYMRDDLEEIIIDDQESYDTAIDYINKVRPEFAANVKFYEESIPLYSRYHIESQIESAFMREITLRSGGSIVIDYTEALISIDINSAKATKGTDIEETALKTNLEAAREIGRQLRLRDLGGLIVIDFIDMIQQKNRRKVEQALMQSLSSDRARKQIGEILPQFGLLIVSRQRIRASMFEAREINCPRCNGLGSIRSTEILAIDVLRVIEEEAIKDNTGRVQAELPIEVATYIMNEKRSSIEGIEKRHHVHVLILPNQYIVTPEYKVTRIKIEDMPSSSTESSHELVEQPEAEDMESYKQPQAQEAPAVQTIHHDVPAPISTKNVSNKAKISLIKRLWASIVGEAEEENLEKKTHRNAHRYRKQHHNKRYNHKKSFSHSGYKNKRNWQDKNNRNSSKQGQGDRRKGGGYRNQNKDNRAKGSYDADNIGNVATTDDSYKQPTFNDSRNDYNATQPAAISNYQQETDNVGNKAQNRKPQQRRGSKNYRGNRRRNYNKKPQNNTADDVAFAESATPPSQSAGSEE